MRIVNNGYSIEVKNINGQKCLSLMDFANLDGHSYTEVCRKVKKRQNIKPFIVRKDGSKVKNTHLTLEGCIKLCETFQFPNDELIKKLLPLVSVRKPTAEEIVDKELLDVKVDTFQGVYELNEKIEKINNRLLDVENNLSYLNDKPKQSNDSMFRQLLKECIKEIIKEELK